MKRASFVFSVLAMSLLGTQTCAPGASEEAKNNSDIESLIDRLADVGTVGSGTHPTAWTAQFMAINEDPRFEGGILGSEPPVVDPTMRKLVQLGVKALPVLINHLSDQRPTKLVMTHSGFGAMWFADEYDGRYTDPKRQPLKVNVKRNLFQEEQIPESGYTVRVGDMCFVAVGQIVNRRLDAVRYQPTACMVINSPTHLPALAAATAKDWTGLTAKEHCAQLEDDAYNRRVYAGAEAVKRLMFYYPADGERVAVKLLGRRLFDDGRVFDLVDEKLMKTDDVVKWRKLYDTAVADLGADAVATAAIRIDHYSSDSFGDGSKTLIARANKLQKVLFPSYSPYKTVRYTVAGMRDQRELVEGLRSFANGKIDAAVQSLFRRVSDFPVGRTSDYYYKQALETETDELAVACADRMAGKGFDKEYLAYFKRRKAEIERLPRSSHEEYGLGEIAKWAKKLGGGKE